MKGYEHGCHLYVASLIVLVLIFGRAALKPVA